VGMKEKDLRTGSHLSKTPPRSSLTRLGMLVNLAWI
jgi:hypothetical protein